MHRLTTALVLTLLLATADRVAGDGASSLAGNWKFVLPLEPSSPPMWLLQLTQKEGRWAGAVISRSEEKPKVSEATLSGLSVESNFIRFTLRTSGQLLRFEGQLPKEAGAPILGSVTFGSDSEAARLEPTTLTSLDRFAVSREVLARQKDGPEVVRAAMTLLATASEKKAKPEEVRAWADRAIRGAEPYGSRYRRDTVLTVAEKIAEQEPIAAEALPFARQAEGLVTDKDSVSLQKRTLDVLAVALERAGKADEARKTQARAEALDFAIKPKPYDGPRGGRVALVELFTGAQCPPCVGADLAFDGLGKTFKPSEVVRLEYHLHIPGPDPLTCPDGLARQALYGEAVEGTPTMFINGRRMASVGGSRFDAPDTYTDLAGILEGVVEERAKAAVKVTAMRKGNQIDIKADVSDLSQTGDNVRLRLALVEDEVAYTGRNGISSYQSVVRAFPGGADGVPLKDKAGSTKVSVDVETVRKELMTYLDKYAAEKPFPSKARPLELKKLSVVAFVQNDETGEILQAARADAGE
jgi:hypothetical protein